MYRLYLLTDKGAKMPAIHFDLLVLIIVAQDISSSELTEYCEYCTLCLLRSRER